jgi:hypothetical protein
MGEFVFYLSRIVFRQIKCFRSFLDCDKLEAKDNGEAVWLTIR